MRVFCRFIIPIIVISLMISFGCTKKANVEREGSKQITVTLVNNGPVAVHLYLEGEGSNQNNLVQPGDTRTSTFLATQVGHNVSIYAKDPAVATQPKLSICRVTQVSWDSQNAVVTWDGQNLTCTTW